MQIVLYGLIPNTMLALFWAYGGGLMLGLAEDITGGTGPFTGAIDMLDTVMPVLVALVYVVLFGYLVYGPIQDERTRRVQVRR